MFQSLRFVRAVAPTADELARPAAGDDLVPEPDVVMDRAFTVPAPPEEVWPWLVQLGKQRAGWYLPRGVERLVPPSRRALRSVDPRWQQLGLGEVIPDYGGAKETFRVESIEPPTTLVYGSRRGQMRVSWSINLTAAPVATTRVHLRLRLGPVRHVRLARYGGGLLDLLTISGLAAGLAERVKRSPSNG